jgi:triphosphatase
VELALFLNAADAARLHRLPAIRSVRSGRSRGQVVRMVWHDSLDRALAADGLALNEQRGVWRLERHRPEATDPWPPATDHRLIEEASEPVALSTHLPDILTSVAAFDGRRTVFPVTIGGEPVTMTLLDGMLRAVAADRPCSRLVLEGPGVAVRELVLLLADHLTLSVPVQSLASEALHLADGTAPQPRRTGAPVLPPEGLSTHAAFAHILGHLADVLLHLAPSAADIESGTVPVHQMRVAVRRARSALSIFPPIEDTVVLTRGADALRELGRMLAPARDWDVFMTETAPPVEAVLPDQVSLRTLLRAGARRRRAARAALSAYLTGAEFRLLSIELACLAAAEWTLPDAEPPRLNEFAAAVLRSRWKKLLHVGKSLEDLDNTALHGLRLKAKRLRYAAEFFAPLFPGRPAARFIRRLSVLQERLGLFNDTTVAETLLRELNASPGYASGLILGFTAARGAGVRPKIAAAWARFRRREPFWE